MSDLAGVGGGEPSGVVAIQARIAQIQGMVGRSTASFSSALATASTSDASATAVSGDDAASMAEALGMDPGVVSALRTSGSSATAATGGETSASSGGTAAKVLAEAKKYLGVKY